MTRRGLQPAKCILEELCPPESYSLTTARPFGNCFAQFLESVRLEKYAVRPKTAEVAVRLTQELKPDVVVLDFAMPTMDGFEAARRIAVVAPTVVMLMFTMHTSDQFIKEAHKAGIQEAFPKSDQGVTSLVNAIESLFPLARCA